MYKYWTVRNDTIIIFLYVAVVEIKSVARNICFMIDSQHYENSCDIL